MSRRRLYLNNPFYNLLDFNRHLDTLLDYALDNLLDRDFNALLDDPFYNLLDFDWHLDPLLDDFLNHHRFRVFFNVKGVF